MLTKMARLLKRSILGKSSHEYMTQFTGNQEYWDRIVAAQVACSLDPLASQEIRGGSDASLLSRRLTIH